MLVMTFKGFVVQKTITIKKNKKDINIGTN